MGVRLTLENVHRGVDATLSCKSCGEVIMKSRGSDEQVVRSKVVILKGNRAYAVCKGCNEEIPLPLKSDAPAASSLGPELYLDR